MCKKMIYLVSFVFVLGIVLTSAANAADPDLLGWWRLDGDASDSSGNNHDGTIFGNPQWVAGKIGGALEFDGTDDKIEMPGTTAAEGFGFTGEVTWMVWFKTSASSSIKTIICQGPTGAAHVQGNRSINVETSGVIMVRAHSVGALTSLNSSAVVNDDEWHHVAITIAFETDGTNDTMKVYIDGDLSKGYETETVNINQHNGLATDFIITLGARGTTPFDGLIDDVRIYSRALSEAEILGAMEGAEGFPYAFGPAPVDGAMLEATWANLGWHAGDFALSHDVYIGENFDDVNDGAEGTFLGNQATTKLIVGFPGFPYPDGLVPGTTYYWRIDEVNDTDPNSPWKGDVWSFWIPPRTAYEPNPADGAKFVFTDVELSWTAGFGAKLHTVYFGDNFDDVNNAVVGLPQSEVTYSPGTLELEKVYYWRIDEFDGVSTYKGDVLSFSTIPDIAITDPSLVGWWTLDEGAGSNALDWSGHGNHGTLFGPEWAVPGYLGDAALKMNGGYVAIQNLSYNDPNGTEVTVCAWIRTSSAANQYIASFDRDNYWRLEINGSGGGDGQVGWDVMTSSGQVDYGSSRRVDDGLWHHVCGVFDNGRLTIYIDGFAEPSASGGPTFGSGEMRSGFIGANSEAGGFNGSRGSGAPIAGEIDELRIYDKALTQEEIEVVMRGDLLLAWNPKPSQGSILYIRDATPLSWSAGDNASGHDVYFGTDRGVVAVADESDTTGIYRGRQGVTIYTPPEVEWGGGPYYWRVDEYNTDATISKGSVWSFSVTDFIEIDGIEDYNDYPPDEIFSTWKDGWEDPMNGSMAGYADPPFAETSIVHGGGQSMPFLYENNFKYSEITMTLVSVRDWTEEGVGVLSLWFYGDSANAAEQMYVALNGSAVVYHDNPDAALIDTWTEWTIDLQEFAAQGVNLTNVNTISIGFGDKNNLQAGGSGMVLFDDIRLYRPAQ